MFESAFIINETHEVKVRPTHLKAKHAKDLALNI